MLNRIGYGLVMIALLGEIKRDWFDSAVAAQAR